MKFNRQGLGKEEKEEDKASFALSFSVHSLNF
jgi:hypothetical protein